MRRRPPRSTRTDTLFPYTTLFRSLDSGDVTSHFEINRSEDTNGLHLRSFGPGCAGAGAPPGALPAAGSSRGGWDAGRRDCGSVGRSELIPLLPPRPAPQSRPGATGAPTLVHHLPRRLCRDERPRRLPHGKLLRRRRLRHRFRLRRRDQSSPSRKEIRMKRLHVHVGVEDIDRSVTFYSTLFDVEPTVRQDDYAKWMLDDPRVNFAISAG